MRIFGNVAKNNFARSGMPVTRALDRRKKIGTACYFFVSFELRAASSISTYLEIETEIMEGNTRLRTLFECTCRTFMVQNNDRAKAVSISIPPYISCLVYIFQIKQRVTSISNEISFSILVALTRREKQSRSKKKEKPGCV